MREAGRAREGSEAIADLPVKCEQPPGWCSGFWLLQMGGSGTHSWPRWDKTFGRRDDVLSCGPTVCEAPGEMSGGQQNADFRGRREVHVHRCGGHIRSEMASKDVGAKSNTTCRKRGCYARMVLPAARAGACGETMVSGSQGEKVCQEEEVVGSLSPARRPCGMWS